MRQSHGDRAPQVGAEDLAASPVPVTNVIVVDSLVRRTLLSLQNAFVSFQALAREQAALSLRSGGISTPRPQAPADNLTSCNPTHSGATQRQS